jgi:hypothetical protein
MTPGRWQTIADFDGRRRRPDQVSRVAWRGVPRGASSRSWREVEPAPALGRFALQHETAAFPRP